MAVAELFVARRVNLLLILLSAISPSLSFAENNLGSQGSPINTSRYSIDLFTGPVLSSSRVTAMGGAYAGLAEGVDGNVVNPAAPAQRQPWSYDWLDFDLSAGLSLSGKFLKTDFDNNGSRKFEVSNFYFITGGFSLQLGRLGIGASVNSNIYNLGEIDETQNSKQTTSYASAALTTIHISLARLFLKDQLRIGLGTRIALFDISANARADGIGASKPLFSLSGYGFEVGGIWAPNHLPVRVGITWRQTVESKVLSGGGVCIEQSHVPEYLPDSVNLPWEFEAGIAWEFGNRPLNSEWVNPSEFTRPLVQEIRRARADRAAALESFENSENESELRAQENLKRKEQEEDLRARSRFKYLKMERKRLLISASLLLSGPVARGVGIESFFRQIVDRSGEKVSFTPRIGLETEPILNWLQIRLGSYLEPSRYNYWRSRLHGTAGFDIKLFKWSVFGIYTEQDYWSAGAVADFSKGYSSYSFRIGVWR